MILYIIRGINLPAPSGREKRRDGGRGCTSKINPALVRHGAFTPCSHFLSLSAPAGVSPHDLDASVKFEFPFPSAVRDRTRMRSRHHVWMSRHLVAASDIDRLNCVTIALVDVTYDADAK